MYWIMRRILTFCVSRGYLRINNIYSGTNEIPADDTAISYSCIGKCLEVQSVRPFERCTELRLYNMAGACVSVYTLHSGRSTVQIPCNIRRHDSYIATITQDGKVVSKTKIVVR